MKNIQDILPPTSATEPAYMLSRERFAEIMDGTIPEEEMEDARTTLMLLAKLIIDIQISNPERFGPQAQSHQGTVEASQIPQAPLATGSNGVA